MPITRRDIVSKVFTAVGGGYDADEVDAFLDLIADTLELREDALHNERQRVALLTAEIRRLDAQISDLRKLAARAENADAEARELIEQAKLQARMVIAAAREEAQKIVQEAREQAELIVQKAVEKTGRRPLCERIAGFALRPVSPQEEPRYEAATGDEPSVSQGGEPSGACDDAAPLSSAGSDAPAFDRDASGTAESAAEGAPGADAESGLPGFEEEPAPVENGAASSAEEGDSGGDEPSDDGGKAPAPAEGGADGATAKSAPEAENAQERPAERDRAEAEYATSAPDAPPAAAEDGPLAERRQEFAEGFPGARAEGSPEEFAKGMPGEKREAGRLAEIVPLFHALPDAKPIQPAFWKAERPAESRPKLEIVKPPRPEDVLDDADGFYPSTDWLKDPDSRYDK